MIRRLLALTLAAVSLVVSQFAATSSDNPYETCFRQKINEERIAADRAPLKDGELYRLNEIASTHSKAMREKETIFHNPNLATQVPAFLAVGENVGMGPSCESIHDAFMASEGHRANILDPDYTHLGVGVETETYEESMDVRLFVTEIFFRPRPTPTTAPAIQPSSNPSRPKPKCSCPKG